MFFFIYMHHQLKFKGHEKDSLWIIYALNIDRFYLLQTMKNLQEFYNVFKICLSTICGKIMKRKMGIN